VSLLAPLFLLGLLTLGLPLWLHRLQTQNPKRQMISSAMLLDRSERRLHVQKRLRFLLLLALRLALLAVAAFAFAQPLWRLAAGAGLQRSARQHLIIVDTSLSMGAAGRMEAARAEALRVIDEMQSGDRAQIVAAGSTIERQATGADGASGDQSALRRAVSQLRAGNGRLEYALAVGAIDSLAGAGDLPVVAHLISDFQSSGLSARFADLLPRSERARRIELQLHPIAAPVAANWAVTGIRQSGNAVDVTVRGHGAPAGTVSVKLEVNGSARGEQRAPITADGEATLRFADVALNVGDNRVVARLGGTDGLAGDDTGYAVLQGGGPQAVPLLTTDPGSGAATFISAALNVSAARFRAAPTRLTGFDARTLERYRWLLVDDAGAVDATLAAALRSYVQSGGALLLATGTRAAGLQTLPVSGEAVRGVTVRTADPLSIGRVDGSHPLLVNTRGWQNVAIARMLKVTPGSEDRVLMATEDGEALLIEQRLGSGRLLLLNTSLDNTWNDLPVAPVFVSFMAEAARWLAGEEAYGSRQLAGAVLPLAQAGATVGQVIDPEGHEMLSLAGTRNAQSVRLASTGFYQVVTPVREALVAVNVDPRESDLTPLDAATLQSWRTATEAAETVAPAPGSVQAAGNALPLARWLLALLALVVIAESLAGNWLLRRSTKVLS
jgi:hypothetical protein